MHFGCKVFGCLLALQVVVANLAVVLFVFLVRTLLLGIAGSRRRARTMRVMVVVVLRMIDCVSDELVMVATRITRMMQVQVQTVPAYGNARKGAG